MFESIHDLSVSYRLLTIRQLLECIKLSPWAKRFIKIILARSILPLLQGNWVVRQAICQATFLPPDFILARPSIWRLSVTCSTLAHPRIHFPSLTEPQPLERATTQQSNSSHNVRTNLLHTSFIPQLQPAASSRPLQTTTIHISPRAQPPRCLTRC